ncbi:MAG: hypothetical protein ACLGID_20425 [Gammaproteobacteria bacterium]
MNFFICLNAFLMIRPHPCLNKVHKSELFLHLAPRMLPAGSRAIFLLVKNHSIVELLIRTDDACAIVNPSWDQHSSNCLRPTSIDVTTLLTKIFCLPNGKIFALQHAAHAAHNQPCSHSVVLTIVNDHQCGLIASPEKCQLLQQAV